MPKTLSYRVGMDLSSEPHADARRSSPWEATPITEAMLLRLAAAHPDTNTGKSLYQARQLLQSKPHSFSKADIPAEANTDCTMHFGAYLLRHHPSRVRALCLRVDDEQRYVPLLSDNGYAVWELVHAWSQHRLSVGRQHLPKYGGDNGWLQHGARFLERARYFVTVVEAGLGGPNWRAVGTAPADGEEGENDDAWKGGDEERGEEEQLDDGALPDHGGQRGDAGPFDDGEPPGGEHYDGARFADPPSPPRKRQTQVSSSSAAGASSALAVAPTTPAAPTPAPVDDPVAAVEGAVALVDPAPHQQQLRCCADIARLRHFLQHGGMNKKRKPDYMQTHGPEVFKNIKLWLKTPDGVAHLAQCGLTPETVQVDHVLAESLGGPWHVKNAHLMPIVANRSFGNRYDKEKWAYVGGNQMAHTRSLLLQMAEATVWEDVE